MIVNQKELVLISYPFSNLVGRKVRPALVVSNNFLNRKSSDCLLVPLTSVIKNKPFSVLITQKDLQAGKLIKNSRIRLDKIFNFEKEKIVLKIGILKDNVFKEIKKELFKMF